MELIPELINTVKMEVRKNSLGEGYLEAVVEKADMGTMASILIKHLGKACKAPGEKAKYPKHIKAIVDSFGGLRNDQSFYYKEGDGQVIYAALWPWQSNSTMTTLKVGAVASAMPQKRSGFSLLKLFKR